ncbi:MAG: IS3 family transposase [Verrucomicrobiales bacterium]
MAGSTSPTSSPSAPAASSAGRWPTTCAPASPATPAPGQIIRSDRASQSMSARTTLYHNASAESFFGTLKREMLRGGAFASGATPAPRSSASSRLTNNTRQSHSPLGYLSPAQFDAQLYSLD